MIIAPSPTGRAGNRTTGDRVCVKAVKVVGKKKSTRVDVNAGPES